MNETSYYSITLNKERNTKQRVDEMPQRNILVRFAAQNCQVPTTKTLTVEVLDRTISWPKVINKR